MGPTPTRICLGCGKSVVDAVHCAECSSYYHPSCLKKKAAAAGSFRCCRDTALRYLHAGSPPPPANLSAPALLPTGPPTNLPSAPSPTFFEDMMRRIDSRFDEIGSRFDEIDKHLSGLPAMQAQIDDHSGRLAELENHNLALSEDVKRLQSTVAELQRSQESGDLEMRRTAAHLRESELIISGVPCATSGAAPTAVLHVATALGVALVDADIISARLLVPRSRAHKDVANAPLPIITRLRSPDLCRHLITAKKNKGVLRSVDLDPQPPGLPTIISVNEALPGDVYKLLVGARAAAKARGYKYVWHSNGVVLLKLRDGGPTRRIRSIQDLEAFEAESPSASPLELDSGSPQQRQLLVTSRAATVTSGCSRDRGASGGPATGGSRFALRAPSLSLSGSSVASHSMPPPASIPPPPPKQ